MGVPSSWGRHVVDLLRPGLRHQVLQVIGSRVIPPKLPVTTRVSPVFDVTLLTVTTHGSPGANVVVEL